MLCKVPFLREVGVSEVDALVHFNLAPLAVRRDIAMLGLIHGTALGKGPPHFKRFFKRVSSSKPSRRHRFHLVDPRARSTSPLVKRSVLGLVAVYNLFPDEVVRLNNVVAFQKCLQGLVRERATSGVANWADTLSPRIALAKHSLK